MKTLMSLAVVLLLATVGNMIYDQSQRFDLARLALDENRPAQAELALADLQAEPLLFMSREKIKVLLNQAAKSRFSLAVELCGKGQYRAALSEFTGLAKAQGPDDIALRAEAGREQGFCLLNYADAQGLADSLAGLALAKQVWQEAKGEPVLRAASASRIAGFAKARVDGLTDKGGWYEALRFLSELQDNVKDDVDLRRTLTGLETLLADKACGVPTVPGELRLLISQSMAQGLATLRLRNDLSKPAVFVLRGPTEQRWEIPAHQYKDLNLPSGGYLLALKTLGSPHAMLDDSELVAGLDYELRLMTGAGRKSSLTVRGAKEAAVGQTVEMADGGRLD